MLCKNLTAHYVIASPIGDLKVSVCNNGVHSLKTCCDPSDENFYPNSEIPVIFNGNKSFPNDAVAKHVVDCYNWLCTYFNDASSIGSVPMPQLCYISETGPFREKVWLALAKNVGPGRTISYLGLAKLVDNPGAARAVGSAMANNPVMLIIPCHRVIKTGGKVGSFGGGVTMKKWLLQHENAVISKDN